MATNKYSGAAFSMLLVISLHAAHAKESEYNASNVLKAVAAAEDAIQTLSVRTKSTYKLPIPNSPEKFYALQGTASCIFELAGRVRYEGRGENAGQSGLGSTEPTMALAVFNGDTVKSMSGGTDFIAGLISNDRNALPWHLDPREATTHFFGERISEQIRKYGGHIVATTQTNEGEVIVWETDPVRSDIERRMQFHIAPDLNFAVIRRSIAARYPQRDTWLEYRSVQGSKYKEASAGIWLPTEVLHQEYVVEEANAIRGARPLLMKEEHIEFSDWVTNPRVGDDVFQFDFAPGIYVTNQVTGENYQTAGISDALLKSHAKEAKDVLAPPMRNPLLKYVLFANFAIALIIALAFGLRRVWR
ncbi:MAG: hypothetical protein H0T47_04125 [Planctomycetaceae bacterium]|nr:hypothetical protein [Planctomycetaceae bacterium]